jgi:ABC-type transport system involved in multi-copper enzyme maturation permease subunit
MTMSKAVMENEEYQPPADSWHVARETAPSLVREEEPTFARWLGLVGLLTFTLGTATIVASAGGIATRVNPVYGSFLSIFGLACLLFHAIRDTDTYIRRAYGLVGYALLGAGILLAVLPIKGPPGTLFLPWGYICLVVALLFLLPFTRNETDRKWRGITFLVIGAIGAALAAIGLVGGNISEDFLIPYSLLLAVLGLAYLWAFIGLEGTSSNFGLNAALALGAVGLIFFFIALGRSILPALFHTLHWIQVRPSAYIVPSGLLLMLVGLLYAAVAVGLCSDNRLVVLTRRELASFFYSPIAYIVFFGFVLGAWIGFSQFISFLFPAPNPFDQGGAQLVPEPIVRFYIVNWLPLIFTIIIGVPLLTMRLVSEERRMGTLEVLFTAPVSEAAVVFSKFLAAMVFFLLAVSPWGLYLIALRVEGGQAFEYRPLLIFLLALACSGAGFLSLGLFFSSLTRNQIASFILTAVGMVALLFVYFLKGNLERTQPGSAWLSLVERASYIDLWATSLDGRVAPQQLVFWVSFAVLWLFVTIKVLESRKWR